MSELLVSVRSAAEARVALAAGAGVIDVKDPSRGSLGRADESILAAVLDAVGGARPVSAAMGELADWPEDKFPPLPGRIAFVKWGLAAADDWAVRAGRLRRQIEGQTPCRVVLTAYADHERASAPSPREVCQQAARGGFSVLLIDTFIKDGRTLLDWLPMREVSGLVAACRDAGVRIALAGGLSARDVEALRPLRPDWFAVRGAACAGGARGAELDGGRTRRLVELVRPPTHGD
jgi:uncharacterized protein (UPF0264 family)